ncbi:MAG: hypothetical protein JST92_14480 [Deltaproteobacteria bacterium]|nr:hypothetical protein [Deltaproteobacteria bacterium]
MRHGLVAALSLLIAACGGAFGTDGSVHGISADMESGVMRVAVSDDQSASLAELFLSSAPDVCTLGQSVHALNGAQVIQIRLAIGLPNGSFTTPNVGGRFDITAIGGPGHKMASAAFDRLPTCGPQSLPLVEEAAIDGSVTIEELDLDSSGPVRMRGSYELLFDHSAGSVTGTFDTSGCDGFYPVLQFCN